MSYSLKCRKCRKMLITQRETSILNVHGEVLKEVSNSVTFDCEGKIVDLWYLKENELPDWIIFNIDNANWLKGKLNCPQCNARIGSFDFISGLKCACKKHLVPTVHIVKSKTDLCREDNAFL